MNRSVCNTLTRYLAPALISGILILCSCHKGAQAYQRARQAEVNQQYDIAHENFAKAEQQDPQNAEYKLREYRTRG